MERLHEHLEITDLKDMLDKTREIYGDKPAYVFKTEQKENFKVITHKEFRDDINGLGTALIKLGLKDKNIGVISENRYDWGVAYLAIAAGTGVVVPLDKSLPDNEIESLVMRSEIEAIFYSKKYDNIMNEIKEKDSTKLKYFISMDLEKEENEILSEKALIQEGKELIKSGERSFLDAKIDNEKMGCLLFTSGTTAMSKGVMLSHKNICSNLMDIASVIEITEDDRLLSFLPLHHTFECTVGFLYPMYKGSSIAFCDGIRHIADNIKEYEITAMISVPILYENMYKKVIKGIEKKGKLSLVKKMIKVSNSLLKLKIDIRKKVFKDVHNTLGGKVRIFVSGGAALDPSVEKGFNDLGFKIVQGYGLTETSPVVAAGNDKYTKIGTIGKRLPSVEIKVENKDEKGIGEIAVKGPNVMMGYYRNEEETNNVLRDGWFYTGDLGFVDKQGFIVITGRKKNVIVLKNGKNIFPEELETLINRIEGVKESFVYGKPDKDDDLKICAKIVYDENIIKELYNAELESEVYSTLLEEVKKINKTMPPYKYIREVIVTKEELIKTTTQKVKRHEELKKVLQK